MDAEGIREEDTEVVRGLLPAFPEVERDVQDDTRSAVRSNPRMGKTRGCSCYTLTVV